MRRGELTRVKIGDLGDLTAKLDQTKIGPDQKRALCRK